MKLTDIFELTEEQQKLLNKRKAYEECLRAAVEEHKRLGKPDHILNLVPFKKQTPETNDV